MRLHTTVMIAPELRAKLDAIAAREGRSRSWCAERALEAWAEAQELAPASASPPQQMEAA